MKFTSTRSTLAVDTLPAILRGLAPDGGLFVPSTAPAATVGDWSTLANAERAALAAAGHPVLDYKSVLKEAK